MIFERPLLLAAGAANGCLWIAGEFDHDLLASQIEIDIIDQPAVTETKK